MSLVFLMFACMYVSSFPVSIDWRGRNQLGILSLLINYCLAEQAFFGVFDGHGGKMAAQFAAENLGRHIDMAIQSQTGEEESLEDAMQAGYLATDSEFLAKVSD